MKYDLIALRHELREELTHNILPFWMERMTDDVRGGFYGQINNRNQLVPDASRGGILNARILWTFSSAAIYLKNNLYLDVASRSFDYIMNHFFDVEHGGTWWMIKADGSCADSRKQIYSQAFFIYAMVEYHRATGDTTALQKSIELYRLIEEHSFDPKEGGYFEAYSADWQLLADLRLSEKDANEKKTMNTHLHVLEAYTNLYRVWKDDSLKQQLRALILLFLDKIIHPLSGHLQLFFDEHWIPRSTLISFGHDIEASWLLVEAARVLDDKDMLERVKVVAVYLAQAASEGLQPDFSLINERDELKGHLDNNRDWWPQAEAMVGYFNAYQLEHNEIYAHRVLHLWEYIKKYIIDHQGGEWFWSANDAGEPDRLHDKAGFWKCPYHNSRMCLELIERIKA